MEIVDDAKREAYLSGRSAKPGYEDWRCGRCGGRRWVGWAAGVDMPRRAQCVPCGHVQDLPAEVKKLTLSEFVLARIAEDEEAARAHHGEKTWTTEYRSPNPPTAIGRWDVVAVARDRYDPGFPVERVAQAFIDYPEGRERSTAEHIALHDPARVLAQCAAMRLIVERCDNYNGEDGWLTLESVVRALACVWSDHPDFDPAWA